MLEVSKSLLTITMPKLKVYLFDRLYNECGRINARKRLIWRTCIIICLLQIKMNHSNFAPHQYVLSDTLPIKTP